MSNAEMQSRRVAALARPGEHAVDSSVTCVVTRFGLRSPRFLLRSFREYREVARLASQAGVPRLLRSAFLVENSTTWYSFSIWRGAPALSAELPEHVDVARRSFGWLRIDPDLGPELWSTKWNLLSVTNNLHWDGFDLRQVLADEGAERA
jgi:hypothetical protein